LHAERTMSSSHSRYNSDGGVDIGEERRWILRARRSEWWRTCGGRHRAGLADLQSAGIVHFTAQHRRSTPRSSQRIRRRSG